MLPLRLFRSRAFTAVNIAALLMSFGMFGSVFLLSQFLQTVEGSSPFEAGLKMLAAGVAKADSLGCKVSLAVVDQSCRLIAFLMMDGARHFSIITTQRKAITAASQRLPTGYAPEENALSMAVRMGDFTNVPGGFPITVGGQVIGWMAVPLNDNGAQK